MITNAPDCSIATDEVRNDTEPARTACSADAIADAALSDPDISVADVAAVPIAADSIAGNALTSTNADMAEDAIAYSSFSVADLASSVVPDDTISTSDTVTVELTVGAISAVVRKRSCQRKEQKCLDSNRVTPHKHENEHFLGHRHRTSMC